jgi:hypothetical protein
MGLKVVMDNGLPITPAASLTRNLLRVADFANGLALQSSACCCGPTASGSVISRPPRWWYTCRVRRPRQLWTW